jgi:hypothetical protein
MLPGRLHLSNPHAFLGFVRSYSFPLGKDSFDGVLLEFCDLCIHIRILHDTRQTHSLRVLLPDVPDSSSC